LTGTTFTTVDCDASKGLIDQLVLVSNDSDAEPVLDALVEDFPALKIGLIMPLAYPDDTKKDDLQALGFRNSHTGLVHTFEMMS